MIIGYRVLLTSLTCAAVVAVACGAVADSATGAKSPEEISRELKTRGVPVMGTMPAPANPAISPANAVPVVPETRERVAQPNQSPVPVPPPAPMAVAHPSVSLKAITFEFGSAQLRPESIEELHNLGIALNQMLKDETKLLIEGHTDKKGTRAYNDELSKRRADAVKDYLLKEMGVSADRLETVGKGFSEPANSKNPYAPENRRVVVVNLGAS